MSLLESLPARPLSEGEVASLNDGESVELAVSVGVTEGPEEGDDPGGPATGLLLVTETWAKGLALVPEEGWQVVETVALADTERFEALQSTEAAVLAFQSELSSEK